MPKPDPALFQLDATMPVVMLPVRLETRYVGRELLIRVYPDLSHADAHATGLSEDEQRAGALFWEAYFRAGNQRDARLAAFSWLTSLLGAQRATYVARSLRPKNLERAPAQPTPATEPLPVKPELPGPPVGPEHVPVRARLLPDRWVAVGYDSVEDEPVFQTWSRPVARSVQMGPDFAKEIAADAQPDAKDFLNDQSLAWMWDFDKAEEIGMALRIDLDAHPRAADGLLELLVFGVSRRDAAGELESLLAAHQYTHGLGLLAQGAPTNNTDSTKSTASTSDPDLEPLLRLALSPLPSASSPSPPAASRLELPLADVGGAISGALGLSGVSAVAALSGADDRLGERSQAMIDALWPATWGWFLSVSFPVVSAAGAQWVREWLRLWVRPGAPLGTLQIGAQPYGLLPVLDLLPANQVDTPRNGLKNTLVALRGPWAMALRRVAHLDPEAPDQNSVQGSVSEYDGETPDQAVTRLAQVLGAVPHPTQLRLRHADWAKNAIQSQYRSDRDEVYGLLGSVSEAASLYADLVNRLPLDSSIGWQKVRWSQADSDIAFVLSHPPATLTSGERSKLSSAQEIIRNRIVPLLAAHEARTLPPNQMPYVNPSFPTDILGDGPPATFAVHDADAEVWTGALVSADGDVGAVADWLEALAAGVDKPAELPSPPPGKPLLWQLLRRSIEVAVDQGARAAMKGGIQRLARVARDGSLEDPLAELERLLRETLGLATHRLDAWITGFATQRLDSLRSQRAQGVQIGAYGWVVNLAPKSAKPSQGYIHAPSLSQASTAAILRAGWTALGSDRAGSTVAVNLSSERVRRGRWILGGVRAGQDLAQLLGQRFERDLHDAELDLWIDDVRRQVLAAAGRPNATANAVVDGLVLARAFSDSDDLDALELATQAAVNDLLAGKVDGAPTEGAAKVRRLLRDLGADFDACADLLLANAVHALVNGDDSTAYASVSSLGSGDAPIPPLNVADTPRRSRLVTHRVIVPFGGAELDGPSWAGAALSPFRHDAAVLERWVASLLPDPGAVALGVRWTWKLGGKSYRTESLLTLAELGLGALDAVYAAPRGEATVPGSLFDRWVQVHARRTRSKSVAPFAELELRYDRFETLPASSLTVEEWVVLAQAAHRVLGIARPLTRNDLAPPDVEGPREETMDFDAREQLPSELDLAQETAALELALGSGGELVEPMLALARRGISAAVPRDPDDGETTRVEAQAALTAARKRLVEAKALRAADLLVWPALDAAARRERLFRRVRHAVGHAFPVGGALATFRASNAADLEASFSVGATRSGRAMAVRGWLRQVAEVRPDVGALVELVDLVEAIADDGRAGFDTAQLPKTSDTSWWANELPTTRQGERLHLVRWKFPGSQFADDGGEALPSFGLAIDSWVEAIPRSQQDTGLAVHFDAPSARAPNAWLLLVAEKGTEWSLTEVRHKVREALDQARLRCVGPEHLEGWGQYVPAAFLGDLADPTGGPA
jgi:hypothetical protein